MARISFRDRKDEINLNDTLPDLNLGRKFIHRREDKNNVRITNSWRIAANSLGKKFSSQVPSTSPYQCFLWI